MELSKQVCSVELAKQLKESGVKQDSLFYWIEYVQTAEYPESREDFESFIVFKTKMGGVLENGGGFHNKYFEQDDLLPKNCAGHTFSFLAK